MLLGVVMATSHTFNDAIIEVNVNAMSSTVINTNVGVDQCGKIIAGNGGLYHMSKEGFLQSWERAALSTTGPITIFPNSVIDFDVGINEGKMVISTSNDVQGGYYKSINQTTFGLSNMFNYTQIFIPYTVRTNAGNMFEFVDNGTSKILKKYIILTT